EIDPRAARRDRRRLPAGDADHPRGGRGHPRAGGQRTGVGGPHLRGGALPGLRRDPPLDPEAVEPHRRLHGRGRAPVGDGGACVSRDV
ncbi:MAG: hypothetical protein AVDCRST_MAG68-3044, partial [uncultured Gemmatimonadetes bacterium]